MSAPCPIWTTRTHNSGRMTLRDADFYDSPRAGGKYDITRSAKINLQSLSPQHKAYLTTWLMDQRRAGNTSPTITSAEVERAEAANPMSITERRDGLLEAIAAHTPELGEPMRYFDYIYAVMGDSREENSYWAQQDYLLAATESVKVSEVETLINFAEDQGLLTSKSGNLALTFAGYAHLEVLRAASQDSHQAFVAMWFGAEVAEAYNQGIAPAVSDAGYKPMRIDQKEHSNKIDDEIIAEIRRSKFLIADFTCGLVGSGEGITAIPRGGVYYEAGFAQGLGIPVIWCCREDHINHVHFDTRQFNHITWKTPEELREKLKNRISAVLGDGPLVSH